VIPARCARCSGQVYAADGELWCYQCGECVSRPARGADPRTQAQVAQDDYRDARREGAERRRSA
jgi:hypothetical protein